MDAVILWRDVEPASFWAIVLVFGLSIGSFLNVVIYRLSYAQVANEKSWKSTLLGKSRCPSCGAAIAPWLNVPVLGWLAIRGKSRCCKTPVSAQYPLIEAMIAAATVLVVMFFSFEQAIWLCPAVYLLTAACVSRFRYQANPRSIASLFWLTCVLGATFAPLVGATKYALVSGIAATVAASAARLAAAKFGKTPDKVVRSNGLFFSGTAFATGPAAVPILLAGLFFFLCPRPKITFLTVTGLGFILALVALSIDNSVFNAILKV